MALMALAATLVGVNDFRTHNDAEPDLAAATVASEQAQAECRSVVSTEPGMTAAQLDEVCSSAPSDFLDDKRFHASSFLSSNGDPDSSWQERRTQLLSAQDNGSGPTNEDGTLLDGVPTDLRSPAQGFTGSVPGWAPLSMLLAGVLAATWIGSDWRSKSIESQMLRVTSRRRLIGAKLAAVAAGGGLIGLAFSLALFGAALPTAIFRGDFAGTGTIFWVDLALTWGRIGLACAALALICGAVASLARNTVAGVLGALGLMSVFGIIGWSYGSRAHLDPMANLFAFVARSDVWRTVQVTDASMITAYDTIAHSWLTAGAWVLVGTLAVVALAQVAFLKRDVS